MIRRLAPGALCTLPPGRSEIACPVAPKQPVLLRLTGPCAGGTGRQPERWCVTTSLQIKDAFAQPHLMLLSASPSLRS